MVRGVSEKEEKMNVRTEDKRSAVPCLVLLFSFLIFCASRAQSISVRLCSHGVFDACVFLVLLAFQLLSCFCLCCIAKKKKKKKNISSFVKKDS